MRIAQVNDVAFVASELARGLRAREHDVTLLQPRLVGARLHRALKPLVGPQRAREWVELTRAIREGDFDVVHIHYAYLGILGVFGKFPYLLHCHGDDIRSLTMVTKALTNAALRGAARVFYVTPDLAEAVLGERPDAEFLPNPIDSGRFAPTSKASESRKVLIVCALDDIKGAGRLLEAARRLASARPDISITALGGGLHEDAFAALSNVVVLPRQPRERLPAIINEHGVVMGQALLGVAGMAEYEAMACARPVVSWFSYGRAYPEPPPFVRALDGLDIAGAVERLVDDPEARLRLGAEGRQWVMKYHSMDAAVERVERAAEDMLRAGPGLLGSAAAGAS